MNIKHDIKGTQENFKIMPFTLAKMGLSSRLVESSVFWAGKGSAKNLPLNWSVVFALSLTEFQRLDTNNINKNIKMLLLM